MQMLSIPPALPPRNVGNTDDISSTHTDSVSFPQQMSTTHVARLLACKRSMQQSLQFMEVMQMMFAREDAERERDNKHQQDREEWEERYRHEREDIEDCRKQRLKRQMQQHMEMMQMMMMTVVHTKKEWQSNKRMMMPMIRNK